MILVGVCGGIAAYKSCELVRLLVKEGHDVQVVQTPDSRRFVGPTSGWKTSTRIGGLSGKSAPPLGSTMVVYRVNGPRPKH